MRNLFDQYDSAENRLTHALACGIDQDRRLLREFVGWVTGRRKLPWAKLKVLEQQIPGVPTEAVEDERDSLPDMWVHNGGNWSLIVETKVTAPIMSGQLHSHRRMAERNDFTDIDLVVLAPTVSSHQIDGVKYLTWPDVYAWLRRREGRSNWAKCVADYIQIRETRMVAEGKLFEPLTRFDGIPFHMEHPYSYREAKIVMRLATGELRKRADLKKLGVDPQELGRGAIRGADAPYIWDYLALRNGGPGTKFSQRLHLTISIQAHRVLVIVSLPNGAPSFMRMNLRSMGKEGFRELLADVASRVDRVVRMIKGSSPFVEVVQKHYPSQSSEAIDDARLEFDPRTAGSKRIRGVKPQRQWADSAYEILGQRGAHYQIGIGAMLPYGDPKLRTRDVLDVLAGIWIGCEPWIRQALRQ